MAESQRRIIDLAANEVLRVACLGCRRITEFSPSFLRTNMVRALALTISEFASRLVCQRCGPRWAPEVSVMFDRHTRLGQANRRVVIPGTPPPDACKG